mgnify:CR=1 FL=1
MLEKVKRTIAKYSMLELGDKVLVGVSGGADSVALLHTLVQLREEYQLSLWIVHLNHMFRGQDAREDAEFVARLGTTLGVPSFIEEVDVPKLMEETGLSAQLAARQARYLFYERIVAQVGAQRVALGHHGDDQAETILMRFLRGAGEDGLAGIPPVRGKIIRPLLEVNRQEIEEYCQQYNLGFRTDYSNLKTIYLRNKIRLELLPLLEKEYNSNIRQTLVRLGDVFREDSSYLQEKALTALAEVVLKQEDCQLVIGWENLVSYSKAMQRRIFREGIRKVKGNLENISFSHLEDLIEFFSREEKGQKILPGNVFLEKSYGKLLIRKQEEPPIFSQLLQIPGTTIIPELGLVITSKVIENSCLGKPKADNPWHAYLDYYPTKGPLVIRNRREGDRFQPLGMVGSKKIKDFFIDEKIPRYERDNIPLLVQGQEILWVMGRRLGAKKREPGLEKKQLFLAVESTKNK